MIHTHDRVDALDGGGESPPCLPVHVCACSKNVLVKGGKTMGTGDVTRKKKLLENQKRGYG